MKQYTEAELLVEITPEAGHSDEVFDTINLTNGKESTVERIDLFNKYRAWTPEHKAANNLVRDRVKKLYHDLEEMGLQDDQIMFVINDELHLTGCHARAKHGLSLRKEERDNEKV